MWKSRERIRDLLGWAVQPGGTGLPLRYRCRRGSAGRGRRRQRGVRVGVQGAGGGEESGDGGVVRRGELLLPLPHPLSWNPQMRIGERDTTSFVLSLVGTLSFCNLFGAHYVYLLGLHASMNKPKKSRILGSALHPCTLVFKPQPWEPHLVLKSSTWPRPYKPSHRQSPTYTTPETATCGNRPEIILFG